MELLIQFSAQKCLWIHAVVVISVWQPVSRFFYFPSSEGDWATVFSMIIFLIIDTATHFLYIFLLAFKCSLLYVSCFVVVPENQQRSRLVASGTASGWMDRRAGQVLSLISEF